MATVESAKQALAQQAPAKSLRTLIDESAKELSRALPAHLSAERLTRIALTCLRLNPELSKCTPESFLGSLFTAAQLGVEPVAGRAYLLPFNNNRKHIDGSWRPVKECQFVLGYKGLADLFYRHEKAVMLNWGVVKANDEFEYEYGTHAALQHKPAKGERGNTTGFYVIAELRGGGKPFMYMSLEDCLAHGRKHSKTFDKKTGAFYDSSPWKTNQDAMCLKTVLIQLAKLLPLSVELQQALEADETSREYRKGIDNALDLPSTTNWDDSVATDATENPASNAEKEIPFGGNQ